MNDGYITAAELSDEQLREILVPPELVGPESYNRRKALETLLERARCSLVGRGRPFPPKATYRIYSPHGNLDAYSLEDARAVVIWPDSVIICLADGSWADRPLCLDKRKRLIAANPSLQLT